MKEVRNSNLKLFLVEDIPEEMKVMYTLLESLPRLVNLIGGPDHAPVLLQPLLDTIADR